MGARPFAKRTTRAVFCFAAPNGPQPGEILSRSASQMPVVRFVASKQAWTGKSVWRSASREPVVRFADSSLRGTVCVTPQLSSYHQPPSQGPSVERRIVSSGFSGRSTGCRSRTMSDESRIRTNLPLNGASPIRSCMVGASAFLNITTGKSLYLQIRVRNWQTPLVVHVWT